MKLFYAALIAIVIIVCAALYYSFQPAKSPSQNSALDKLSKLSIVPSGISLKISPSSTSAAFTPTPSSATIAHVNATTATIKTAKGDIILELYPKDAPNTVKNFVNKAKSGFYNNLTFHRVEDWVIQGGDPLGNGTGGGSMPVEFNSKPFVVGSLGVASRGDGKTQNDAQFFITKTDASWLNKQYTNFGIVKSGMDVVNKIQIGDTILGITIQ